MTRHVAKLKTHVEGDTSLMTYTGHTILQTLIRYSDYNIQSHSQLWSDQVPLLSCPHHGPESDLHWLRRRQGRHLWPPHRGNCQGKYWQGHPSDHHGKARCIFQYFYVHVANIWQILLSQTKSLKKSHFSKYSCCVEKIWLKYCLNFTLLCIVQLHC